MPPPASPPATGHTPSSPAADVCASPSGGGDEPAASPPPFSAAAPSLFTAARHTSPLSGVFSFHRPFSPTSSPDLFLSARTLFGSCSSSTSHLAARSSVRLPGGFPAVAPPSSDAARPVATTVISPLRALPPAGRMPSTASASESVPQVPEVAASSPPGCCVVTKPSQGSAQSPPSHSGENDIVHPEDGEPEANARSPTTNPKRPASVGDAAGEPPGKPTKLLMGSSQKPHYMPLQCQSKRVRRNLIAGYDRAFVETAETIQSVTRAELEGGDDQDLRVTLDELEAMGYGVASLRRRLGVLRDTATARDAAAAEMGQWMRKVEEREEELRLLRAEMAEVRTRESEKEEEIREMMRWVEEIRGGIKFLEDRFDDMARAPLL